VKSNDFATSGEVNTSASEAIAAAEQTGTVQSADKPFPAESTSYTRLRLPAQNLRAARRWPPAGRRHAAERSSGLRRRRQAEEDEERSAEEGPASAIGGAAARPRWR